MRLCDQSDTMWMVLPRIPLELVWMCGVEPCSGNELTLYFYSPYRFPVMWLR